MAVDQAAGVGVFVSYRRGQEGSLAGRLSDRLVERFGGDRVFIDVDSIEPGMDFIEAIETAVAACGVLLAVIGPQWLVSEDERGGRRLDDPDDLVRREIETALLRGIRVIPVLADGAVMPRGQDLPDSLAGLARRNALSVRHETFRDDGTRLVTVIARILDAKEEAAGAESHPDARNRRSAPKMEATPAMPSDLIRTLYLGNEVRAIAFSPDGRLATACLHSCAIWDPFTGEKLDLEVRSAAGGVSFSADGRFLATGAWDNTVDIWDPATGAKLRTLTGHTGFVQDVAFSPDGSLLASASDDRTVRIWNPVTGKHLGSLTEHTKQLRAIAFSPDGHRLAAGTGNGKISIWDPMTGDRQHTLTHGDGDASTSEVRSVAFSPDGRLLAATGVDPTQIWDVATFSTLRTVKYRSGTWCAAIAFRAVSRLLAEAASDGALRIYDLVTGKKPRTLPNHSKMVNDVAFSPDGRLLATASADMTVRLWK